MKKMAMFSFVIFLSFSLSSCGEIKKPKEQKEVDTKTNVNKNDCLLSYRDKTCDLISMEKVAQILGISLENVSNRDNSNVLSSSPNLIACLFETSGENRQGTISVGQIGEDVNGVFKTKYLNDYYNSDDRFAEYIEDNLGDGAVHLIVSNNTILSVLIGSVEFKVQIYGNQKSNTENLANAKQIAKEVIKVLENCK